jgi:hypothetical protein
MQATKQYRLSWPFCIQVTQTVLQRQAQQHLNNEFSASSMLQAEAEDLQRQLRAAVEAIEADAAEFTAEWGEEACDRREAAAKAEEARLKKHLRSVVSAQLWWCSQLDYCYVTIYMLHGDDHAN